MSDNNLVTILPEHLTLDDAEMAFFKAKVGIDDDTALKEHIISVAAQALEVYPYWCIRTFGFLRFRIARSSGYDRLVQLGSNREAALFLDLGCCFGVDIRKAIADGYPAENVIGSDLRADFWEFGHTLFKSNQDSFPVAFVPGNALDESFIAIAEPLLAPPLTPRPDLDALTSLNPLRGHLSAIHASAFFHLFNKEEQLLLAKKLASLLSPLPGSLIFGSHMGTSGDPTDAMNGTGTSFYRHSVTSWKAMWVEEVFGEGMVKVEAGLGDESRLRTFMWWIVTRL